MKTAGRGVCRGEQKGYRRARQLQRASRTAASTLLAALILSTVAVVSFTATVFGFSWVRARAETSPLFGLDVVEVAGNRSLPVGEVLRIAGVRRGESLFALDLEAIRRRLERHPYVRTAAVRRRLPRDLVVEVAERTPAAVVLGARHYLVDREGEIMASLADPGEVPLPRLGGVGIAGERLDGQGRDDLRDALALLAAARDLKFPSADAIDHLEMSDPADMVIVPASGRPRVHVGRRDFLPRLRRWRRAAPDLARRWPRLEEIDLRAEGLVVALPAAEEPGPAPAAPGKG